MGEKFFIRDITEEGFSLESETNGETGIFLTHDDYREYKDENTPKTEYVKTDNAGGTIVKPEGKSYKFKMEYTPEELEQLRGKTRRRTGSRWRKNEPIQTEETKAKIEEENKINLEKLKTSLKSKEYQKFKDDRESRGFKIQENQFIAKKEIEVEGTKFNLRSVFDKEKKDWVTSTEGKVKKLQIGDEFHDIEDVSKEKVTYDNGIRS